MRFLARLALLAAVAGLTPPARAQVVVSTPGVYVRAGGPGPVVVRAPFVRVQAGGGGPVVVRAPYITVRSDRTIPVLPAVSSVPVVPAAPPAPVVVAALTPAQFAASFRAVPGTYHVTLTHPFTGLPVKVRFTLPPGYPRRVVANRRKLEFDYGRRAVIVRFLRNGKVVVRN
jgi:hypothetical protein